MFQKGDLVVMERYGEGVVCNINYTSEYPVLVKFYMEQICTFTEKGLCMPSDISPSLHFQNEYKPATSKEPCRRPDLKVDDPVIVWGNSDYKERRCFSGWNDNGSITCFIDGKNEFTSKGITSRWHHYELPSNE